MSTTTTLLPQPTREYKLKVSRRLRQEDRWDYANAFRETERLRLRSEGMPKRQAVAESWRLMVEAYPPYDYPGWAAFCTMMFEPPQCFPDPTNDLTVWRAYCIFRAYCQRDDRSLPCDWTDAEEFEGLRKEEDLVGLVTFDPKKAQYNVVSPNAAFEWAETALTSDGESLIDIAEKRFTEILREMPATIDQSIERGHLENLLREMPLVRESRKRRWALETRQNNLSDDEDSTDDHSV